jgi:glycosyltransferase involved in cell wall biosynthesis
VRLALDAFPLQVRSAGIAVYTEGLIRALAAVQPDLAITLFGLPGALQRATDDGAWPAAVRWHRSLLYPLIMGAPLMQLPRLLPLEAALRGADLFHATNYTAPRTRSTPLVLTVHDLALLRFPELGTPALRRHVQRVGATAAHARRVIADSESTARDLRELVGIDAGKIHVVYPGCDARFFRAVDPVAVDAARARYGIAAPYVLHVGTLEPRKNLERLVRAFASARAAHRLPHRLVLCGPRGWGSDALHQLLAAPRIAGSVHWMGPAARDDLPALYAGATLFVYPSLYEGFGFPPLEAMACGTPVLTTAVASLPEVVGDAAVLVDPYDEAALAERIARLLQDPDGLANLSARGRPRAAQFTWERCARETLAVYREAL